NNGSQRAADPGAPASRRLIPQPTRRRDAGAPAHFHFNRRDGPDNDSVIELGAPSLLPLLKQYFGFTSFRPLQEEIIRDVMAGKDVFALLPTGGGKSLCFQLPAMAGSGLTLVVSPLIALMKDQVDGLQASGMPATF